MHRQWPFFRTLLSNLDMVLAKSDLRIAARYVELVEDPSWRGASSPPSAGRVGARARGAVADHRRAERLQSNPALARSIEHRFPYLDPLNHLQVELLRRYRQRRDDDRRWSASSAASTCRSTASPRGCATPAEAGPRPRRLQRAPPAPRAPRHLPARHRQPFVERRHAHGPAFFRAFVGFVAAAAQLAHRTRAPPAHCGGCG
jgi:hypothetical protein